MDEYAPELRERFRMIWHSKTMIIATAAVAGVIAFAYSLMLPKTYEAESRLVIRPILPQAAFASSGLATAEGGPLGLDVSIDSQAEVVRSGSVARRVASSLGMATPVDELTESVAVEPVTNEILGITVSASGPRLASRLANAFANEYLEYRRDSAGRAVDAVAQDLSVRIEGLEATVSELDDSIVSLSVQAADLPATEVAQRAALQAEIDRYRAERNELLIQLGPLRSRFLELNFAGQAASIGGGDVIQRAVPPSDAASPHPLRDGALGIILGFLLGAGLVWLRQHIDPRILTKDEAARAARAPVLASIPRSKGWLESLRPALLHRLRGRVWRRDQDTDVPEPSETSIPSEAYRTLRSNLVALGLGTKAKCLLVASDQAREPVAETVANLAAACANAGLRTMAISADFDRESLPSLLGVRGEGTGLAEVLKGDVSLERGLRKTPLPNLVVLAPGASETTPVDLLASYPIGRVLDRATKTADVILIEAPAVSGGADTMTLAGYADATLLVARIGVARGGSLARATSLLEQAGSPVLGLVLHDVFDSDDTPGIIREHVELVHTAGPNDDGRASESDERLAQDKPKSKARPRRVATPTADRQSRKSRPRAASPERAKRQLKPEERAAIAKSRTTRAPDQPEGVPPSARASEDHPAGENHPVVPQDLPGHGSLGPGHGPTPDGARSTDPVPSDPARGNVEAAGEEREEAAEGDPNPRPAARQ
jgi:capsular exopolysaccharide synthesis family protein